MKASVVTLDSELFICRYTQTPDYTFTTPTGNCGSKNKKPNNTHLNLRGTQMSPVFLELRCILLQFPLKLCKLLFCVFIFCCSNTADCALCVGTVTPDVPKNVEEMGPVGPGGPGLYGQTCSFTRFHILAFSVTRYRVRL